VVQSHLPRPRYCFLKILFAAMLFNEEPRSPMRFFQVCADPASSPCSACTRHDEPGLKECTLSRDLETKTSRPITFSPSTEIYPRYPTLVLLHHCRRPRYHTTKVHSLQNVYQSCLHRMLIPLSLLIFQYPGHRTSLRILVSPDLCAELRQFLLTV
jgi:hypothetical protein